MYFMSMKVTLPHMCSNVTVTLSHKSPVSIQTLKRVNLWQGVQFLGANLECLYHRMPQNHRSPKCGIAVKSSVPFIRGYSTFFCVIRAQKIHCLQPSAHLNEAYSCSGVLRHGSLFLLPHLSTPLNPVHTRARLKRGRGLTKY